MAKVTIKGVFETRKTLADGTVRSYFYHRATGTRLPGAKGSPEFLAAYVEAQKLAPVVTNNVAALIRQYLLSARFEKKRASTQAEYRRILAKVEERFGTMPIAALASPKVRGVFLDYQEEIGIDRPREADNRLSVLSAVFSHAKARGTIKDNPLDGFCRIYGVDRSEIIWRAEDIARFMEHAPVELQRVMIMAIHTGQRYGDLIRLRWSDFDGQGFRLRQGKTKATVFVPCTRALLAMLTDTPRHGPYVLTRADGRPWFTEGSDKELAKAWRRHMDAAGFYPRPFAELSKAEKQACLHFHDLRGTAITLLAEAGATVPQIVAITGHTLQSATRILEKYQATTRAMADAAILKFENAPATAFANRLQTGTQPGKAATAKTKGKQ